MTSVMEFTISANENAFGIFSFKTSYDFHMSLFDYFVAHFRPLPF